MSLSHPSAVTVVEVGPRDGLQNEAAPVSTDDKITFVNLLSAAGLRVVEVSAFVNPKRVPQMADAGEVFARIERRPSTRYTALVPNLTGLDRAHAARVGEVAIFAAASETFSRRTINQSIGESLDTYRAVCNRAAACRPRHVNWSAVAGPTAIGRVHHKLHALQIARGAFQVTAGEPRLRLAAHQNANEFSRGDLAHHFGVHPADGVKFVGPVRLVMRPTQPCGRVGLPLRRH